MAGRPYIDQQTLQIKRDIHRAQRVRFKSFKKTDHIKKFVDPEECDRLIEEIKPLKQELLIMIQGYYIATEDKVIDNKELQEIDKHYDYILSLLKLRHHFLNKSITCN